MPILALALLCLASTQDQAPERGLLVNEPEAYQGYTMISPLRTNEISLVDMDGRVVHRWQLERSGSVQYFLEDGSFLQHVRIPDPEVFSGGGQAGCLQRVSWDGTVTWEWDFASADHLQHHDIAPTPEGTILFVAWEFIDHEEALAAGRDPEVLGADGVMWPDFVVEIEPIGADEAEVIWEWHTFDHLIQDRDPALPNHGDPSAHPERVDVNGDEAREFTAAELAQMRALGYLVDDGDDGEKKKQSGDWQHTNAIDYDPVRDLIVLSVPRFNEVWIIDHSTTLDEAVGSTGGNFGKGGDLLWRWGNAASYGMAKTSERALFFQHDTRFIPPGFPGAGNVTVFNNGRGRPGGSYSSVLELELPLKDGAFVREDGFAFGPEEAAWEYQTGDEKTFYSSFISGAHRLPNGNTLCCVGDKGWVIEVDRAGRVVWDFRHEFDLESSRKDVGPGALFRAIRMARDHPALQGKDLRPLQDG